MNNKNIQAAITHLKNQLIEKYKPEKIILFGSAAKGRDEINDIDLFIIKEDVPYYGADRIRELYHLVDTDIAVDFVVYRQEEIQEYLLLGDPFIKKILNEGTVLYG